MSKPAAKPTAAATTTTTRGVSHRGLGAHFPVSTGTGFAAAAAAASAAPSTGPRGKPSSAGAPAKHAVIGADSTHSDASPLQSPVAGASAASSKIPVISEEASSVVGGQGGGRGGGAGGSAASAGSSAGGRRRGSTAGAATASAAPAHVEDTRASSTVTGTVREVLHSSYDAVAAFATQWQWQGRGTGPYGLQAASCSRRLLLAVLFGALVAAGSMIALLLGMTRALARGPVAASAGRLQGGGHASDGGLHTWGVPHDEEALGASASGSSPGDIGMMQRRTLQPHSGRGGATGHGHGSGAIPGPLPAGASAAPPAHQHRHQRPHPPNPDPRDWCLPQVITMEFEGDWRGTVLRGSPPVDGRVKGIASVARNETHTAVYVGFLSYALTLQEQWVTWGQGGRALTVGRSTALEPASGGPAEKGAGERDATGSWFPRAGPSRLAAAARGWLQRVPLLRWMLLSSGVAGTDAASAASQVSALLEEVKAGHHPLSAAFAELARSLGATSPCVVVEDEPATGSNSPRFCARSADTDLRFTGFSALGSSQQLERYERTRAHWQPHSGSTHTRPRAAGNATLTLLMERLPLRHADDDEEEAAGHTGHTWSSHPGRAASGSGRGRPVSPRHRWAPVPGKSMLLPVWHAFGPGDGSVFVDHLVANARPSVDPALFAAMPHPAACAPLPDSAGGAPSGARGSGDDRQGRGCPFVVGGGAMSGRNSAHLSAKTHGHTVGGRVPSAGDEAWDLRTRADEHAVHGPEVQGPADIEMHRDLEVHDREYPAQ